MTVSPRFRFFISIGTVFCIFIACNYTFGFHYEILEDSYRIAYMRGLFLGVPVDNFFIYLNGFSQLYTLLYGKFPAVEWYSYGNLLFLFAASLLLFYWIYRAMSGVLSSGVAAYLVSVSLFVLLFCDFIIGWHWSKTAAICAIAAFIFLCDYSLDTFVRRNFLSVFLLLAALLIRFESVLVLMVIFALYHIVTRKDFSPVVVPGIILVVFFSIYTVQTKYFPSRDRQLFDTVEPYVFSYQDAGSRKCSLPATITPQDSVKMLAFEHWFFTDKPLMDTVFLNRYFSSNVLSKCSFHHVWQKLKRQWREYGEYLTYGISYLFVLLFLLLIFCLKTMPFSHAFRLMVFNVLFVLLMFCIVVVIKLEKRHIISFLTFACCLNLYEAFAYLKRKAAHAHTSLAFALFFIACIAASSCIAFSYLDKFSHFKREEEKYSRELRQACARFEKKTIVPDLWAMLLLGAMEPFEVAEFSGNNDVLIYDSAYGTFYENVRTNLTSRTGSDTFVDFARHLKKNKDSIVYIGNPERTKILQDYLAIVHNEHIRFIEVNTGALFSPSAGYGVGKNLIAYTVE